jgi:GNAT superfamily N-acetyltransferase
MTTHQQAEITVHSVSGPELERYIPELARLRIQVFREYPYLYQGDTDYEANYLRTYSQSQGSVVVLALDAERVVGASTALPLIEETEEVVSPFRSGGYAPGEVFYLGESVLLPDYRGRGIGVRFFQEREAHARALAMDPVNPFGPFRWFAFCAVERDPSDPRRPRGYVPLDDFWRNRGYRRQPQLRTAFSWRELDEAAESPKPMVFWLKPA